MRRESHDCWCCDELVITWLPNSATIEKKVEHFDYDDRIQS